MTRRTVQQGSWTYAFSPDSPVPIGRRMWGIIEARVTDELTGEPPSGLTFDSAFPGLLPRVAEGGICGLVGFPDRVLSDLGVSQYTIPLTIKAERYVPYATETAIGPEPGFMAGFTPKRLDFEMHREPTILHGRVTLAGAPVANATVSLAGVWRTAPSAHVTGVAADPPNLLSLEPALYFARDAATSIITPCALTSPDPPRQLRRDADAGATTLALSDAAGLAVGDVLAIDASDPERAEYLPLAGTPAGAQPGLPAEVTLAYGSKRLHKKDAVVQLVAVQLGMPVPLNHDAIAGDTCVFPQTMQGLTNAVYVRLSGTGIAGKEEYHRAYAFSVTTNAEGYYRFPGVSRVAQVLLHVTDGAHNPAQPPNLRPDYDQPMNRLDLVIQ
jgi:hypothetical protein